MLIRKKLSYLIATSIAGIASGLSFNHPSCSFLIWVALIPFFWVVGKAKKGIVFYSYLCGFLHYLTMLFWLSYVTFLGMFLLLLYLSSYWAIFGCFSHWSLKRGIKTAIPCFWVLLEFLREYLLTGFGWGLLGYSQFRNTYLIGIADIGGTKAISFLIILVNLLLFFSLEKRRLLTKEIFTIIILLLVTFFYSFYRIKTIPGEETLAISVVQPNIPQEEKWDPSFVDSIIQRLIKLGEASCPHCLVIFPEASWPLTVDENNSFLIKKLPQRLKRDVLIGAVEEKNFHLYNSVLYFNKKGEILGIYRKIKLVPFGEYVPFRKFLHFIDVLNALGDISPGKEVKIFFYHRKKFAPLICFEDIFPFFVTKLAERADFLVNVTNDGWFSGNPEAIQHWAIMTLRAVENRISIVRAANTGISGGVDFNGHPLNSIRQKDTIFTAKTLFLSLPLNKKRSFYTHFPELFTFICGLVLIVTISLGIKQESHPSALT